MYRIVSRALALFYFYLPPRLSFSLLLKRTTNALSLSPPSGEAKSLKKKKRFERERNRPKKRSDLFSREILIEEFQPFKSKTKCLRVRTFANTLKNTQTTNTFRALDYWYARSVVLIFSALTFCAFAHGCAVYQKKVSGGRNFRSVDRIFVSVSHVRRAQSSRLDEVPNFLERRSASQSVLFTIFRNSDIDAYRACGE